MNYDDFITELETNVRDDLIILRDKNSDYASDSDPFQNFRMVENNGLCSVEKGILVRMSDKMQRITNLISREAKVKDESIMDTLSDLRNYANILQVYLTQAKHLRTRCENTYEDKKNG